MKYPFIITLSVLLIPLISQSVYAQNIVDEIGEAFNNLTSGLIGSNNANQSSGNATNNTNVGSQSTNGTSSASSNSTGGTSNQSESNQSSSQGGIGSIQELQNLTSANQKILENGSSIGNNVSLLEGMEKSQLGAEVLGGQDVRFEGDIIENATSN